jgi:hypothetical protein
MRYGSNVDITSYKAGVRKTHNANLDGTGGQPGMADADSVWHRFDKEAGPCICSSY